MIDERDLVRHLQSGGPMLWDRLDPPPLDLERITGSVTARRRGLVDRARSVLARRLQLPPLVLAGGALACGGIGVAAGMVATAGEQVQQGAPASAQVALVPFDEGPAGARAVVRVVPAGGETVARMQASGLPEPPAGRHYAVWAIADDGQMVSLGELPVSARGTATGEMRVPVDLQHFRTLDVAVQPDDGPPVHSGHSVLRSTT